MMKHALTRSFAFLLMTGLLYTAPAHAAAAVAASPTSPRAADMAARLQPAEQQAVLQARPAPAGDGDGNVPGLLAWPGVPRLGLPVLRMPTFATPVQPGDGPPRPMLPWLALAATWDPDLAPVARWRGPGTGGQHGGHDRGGAAIGPRAAGLWLGCA
ncbi:hypothetical protein [Komagataeibacter sp. NFXK3]